MLENLDKILIADDDLMNQEVLRVVLEKKYQVRCVSSGLECLSALKEDNYRPDLILLDIVMPNLDGFEVCNIIKKDAAYADIPVIFLSAKLQSADKVKAFGMGGADYITKPFDFDEVSARIKTHIDLKNALAEINDYNKNLEKMLEQRTKELIQSERASAFSLLIQGIIHNLKGPIAIMNGNSEIINMLIKNLQSGKIVYGEKFIADLTRTNSRINSASHKLNDMVESMMAKSSADKSEQLEVVNLNTVLSRELEFMEVDLSYKHKIRKTINLCSDDLPVNVVVSEINQLVENLIRNSLDAMWQQENSELIIESGRLDGKIWFSVADNGPGIPKELADKIFDPFFTTKPRERKEDSKQPTGTGLGLYSCREIVRTYNGMMQLDQEQYSGAKFIITLPAAK